MTRDITDKVADAIIESDKSFWREWEQELDAKPRDDRHYKVSRVQWLAYATAAIKAISASPVPPSEPMKQLSEWMLRNSFATGHGDTMEDLLAELASQVAELRSASPVPPSEPVGWRMPLQGALSGKYQLTQHADIAAMWREGGATVLPLYAHPSPGSVLPPSPRDEGKLQKLPVAFRVEVIPGNGAFEYFDYEDDARECADAAGVKYEGLFVRDGTPLNFASPRDEAVEALKEANFLIDRLSEFEWSSDTMTDDGAREWNGHISPSLIRLKNALAKLESPHV